MSGTCVCESRAYATTSHRQRHTGPSTPPVSAALCAPRDERRRGLEHPPPFARYSIVRDPTPADLAAKTFAARHAQAVVHARTAPAERPVAATVRRRRALPVAGAGLRFHTVVPTKALIARWTFRTVHRANDGLGVGAAGVGRAARRTDPAARCRALAAGRRCSAAGRRAPAAGRRCSAVGCHSPVRPAAACGRSSCCRSRAARAASPAGAHRSRAAARGTSGGPGGPGGAPARLVRAPIRPARHRRVRRARTAASDSERRDNDRRHREPTHGWNVRPAGPLRPPGPSRHFLCDAGLTIALT